MPTLRGDIMKKVYAAVNYQTMTYACIRRFARVAHRLEQIEREIELSKADPWWVGTLREQYNRILKGA